MRKSTKSLEEYFWERVNKHGPVPAHRPRLGRCHVWTGGKNPGGYGNLKTQGKTRSAHVVGFELQNGPVPTGMCVLHKCDNRACIRGSHLFLGTYKDNAQDAAAKGRHKNPRMPGELHPLARLTQVQVSAMRAEFREGTSKPSLEMKYKITRRHLNRVLSGERWNEGAGGRARLDAQLQGER